MFSSSSWSWEASAPSTSTNSKLYASQRLQSSCSSCSTCLPSDSSGWDLELGKVSQLADPHPGTHLTPALNHEHLLLHLFFTSMVTGITEVLSKMQWSHWFKLWWRWSNSVVVKNWRYSGRAGLSGSSLSSTALLPSELRMMKSVVVMYRGSCNKMWHVPWDE